MDKKETILHVLESLSATERIILPHLHEKFIDICKKTNLEEVAVLRALEFLGNKKIIELKIEAGKIADLGVNGILYKKKGLPERRLVNLLAEKKQLKLNDAKKHSELNDNEFQAALGALKKKALINVANGELVFSGTKEEISRKSLEEQLLEILPHEYEKLKPEQKFAFESLKNRKNIVEIQNKNEVSIKITELGKEIIENASKSKMQASDFIESLTPEVIASGDWKGKKFRRYDTSSPVPKISGGKRHFVNQATDYARKIWTDVRKSNTNRLLEL
jgi:phenylalanyl-tRNA synthetase alpha chain